MAQRGWPSKTFTRATLLGLVKFLESPWGLPAARGRGRRNRESVLGHPKGSERSYKQIKNQFETGLCDTDCH